MNKYPNHNGCADRGATSVAARERGCRSIVRDLASFSGLPRARWPELVRGIASVIIIVAKPSNLS